MHGIQSWLHCNLNSLPAVYKYVQYQATSYLFYCNYGNKCMGKQLQPRSYKNNYCVTPFDIDGSVHKINNQICMYISLGTLVPNCRD